MDGATAVLVALLPPLGVGLVFWFVMRMIIGADRRERQALARLAEEERRRQGGAAADVPAPDADGR
ncbi:hypothetical protein [Cellulomonas endophytica]|uniref:hypothetical protein n=1 Tax=Cellulomonas endophytica TaxID=2494735 RepID=UPI00101114A5|nr:hypothetical protein [Cellulomonas endophytica]